MKKFKKISAFGLMIVVIGAMGMTALAAYSTPAEITAGLTGKTVDSVIDERANGKPYGAIANEAGKLEEFKEKILETKKALLAERVAEGTMTQERADEIIAALEERQANCDGTGGGRIGQRMRAGFGRGGSNGQGRGQNGFGLGQGVCGGLEQ